MESILHPGVTLTGHFSKLSIEVGARRGLGKQGEVYHAVFDGRFHAVKWFRRDYLPHDPGLRARIERLIHLGPPSPDFLWPLDLALNDGERSFGYVMPWLDERFSRMRGLLERRVEPSFFVICTVGLNLAQCFLLLHSKGYCYRDINFDNIAFDPETGDVNVLDNDNVDVDKSVGAIIGTPLFMAPEIVRRESQPWSRTDLHSLSVLLFYTLCLHHPFEGKRELLPEYAGREGQLRLYREPLFIFDPDDDSNAPDPNSHPTPLAYWKIYPQWLLDLFRQSFGPGLYEPEERIQEGQWRRAMSRLRDSLLRCGACGAENFYDAARLALEQRAGGCWACGAALKLPPRLRVMSEVVVLSPGVKLYPHHVDPAQEYDFSTVLAEVSEDGAQLLNLSGRAWQAQAAGGEARAVEPGEAMPVDERTRLTLGRVQGEIRP